jgi:hypothetical protein
MNEFEIREMSAADVVNAGLSRSALVHEVAADIEDDLGGGTGDRAIGDAELAGAR